MGDEAVLAWWFLAALLLGVCASPFLAMRRVVEASLPAWMLLLRRRGMATVLAKALVAIVLIVNCGIGFLVAAADYEFAAVYPRFASHPDLVAATRADPSRVWCHGYWGWSHYTRAAGMSHYVLGGDRPAVGGWLVIPVQVAKPAMLPDELRFGLEKRHDELRHGTIPIRVMNYQAGAGYYGSAWGPLPYSWSSMPLEVFGFWELASAEEPNTGSRAD